MLYPSPNRNAAPPRVVITGAGIVTALGLGWKPNAEGFQAGRSAFCPVSLFDVSRQRVKTAAQVNLPDTLPSNNLAPRQVARLDRAAVMLLLASTEAWRQAGWDSAELVPFVLGTTAGGMQLGEKYFLQAREQPRHQRGQPTRALCYQSQTQARLVAEALGFTGPVMLVSNACASGANAIGQAWELIRGGRAQRALTGGYDALSQIVFAGFDSLQALTPTTCRPFDAARDGLALGEGAGIVALETLESARRRGAEILAELVGYGTTVDTHHLTQPHPQGDAALSSMRLACESAHVAPADIDYVNAHGTGTPLNDSAEALAICRWADGHAATLPVSSTKASVGHLLGGAGAVEAVVCIMSLREQWLPPEASFDRPDPVCKFPIVAQPQSARLDLALSNSFGFGGVNASLVLKRWH
ncbi:MAG TPA: beta-ketoacyl-[acyl-carrier-protein] synthase family protein [Verrucomicrobiae bacterium]